MNDNGPVKTGQHLLPGGGGVPKLLVTTEHETLAGDEAMFAADQALLKRVGAILMEKYPGHQWSVWVSHQQGLVRWQIPILHGHFWYVQRLAEYSDEAVVRGGGELLERFRMPRTHYDLASFLAARERRIRSKKQKFPE